MAVACLFLAGKVEEKALKLKDLVHGYFAVRWRHGKPTEEVGVYRKRWNSIVNLSITKTLCFLYCRSFWCFFEFMEDVEGNEQKRHSFGATSSTSPQL